MEIVSIIKNEITQNVLLLDNLNNMIISDEAKRLKTDDPVTFCELLAFYEETKRHDDEVKKISTRLGMSD